METTIKIIITLLFITLIAIAIVFFGVFGLIPLIGLTETLKKPELTPIVEEEILQERLAPIIEEPVAEESVVEEPSAEESLVEKLPSSELPPGPESQLFSTPEGVAIPVSVSKIGSGSFINFIIRGENKKYFPFKLVVDEGDIITIHFTSVDSDYNIFFPDFGVYRTIPIGETSKIQFQVSGVGEYQFFCKDVCQTEIIGTLIVNQK